VVGRSLDADLNLSDPFLSRRHSRLFCDGGRLFVEDLGSRNGTLLNGRRLEGPAEVRTGDSIQISESRLTLVELVEPAPAPGPEVAAGRSSFAGIADGTILVSAADLLEKQRSFGEGGYGGSGFGDLRRLAERLRLLNEVHQALGRSIAQEELFELILDRVFDHLRPDRAALLLRSGDDFVVAARRASGSVSGEGGEIHFSRSLAREVVDKGMAALVVDVQSDERFAAAQSLLLSGVRSLIAAPLLDPDGTVGLIALESKRLDRTFQPEDVELLVSLASVAALHLRNARLAEEAAERRRMAEELALARRIQVALLPSRLPEVEGWELESGNIPSRGVSGDYFEVTERRSIAGTPEIFLFLADVSGKGMGASLLTASLQAFAAGPIEDGLPPEEVSARLSRLLYRRTPPEKYATAFLAALDPASGRLRYTNAGHNPPLLLRAAGGAETLPPSGVPIGLLPTAPYQAREVELEPGDVLVAYTDGIVEATDPEGEEYGEARLLEACRSCLEGGGSPAAKEGCCRELSLAIDEHLRAFVRAIPFADDRTLLLVRRLPASPTPAERSS
jgi:serine phosphatase RsbU (regulator of sigma subunit)